MTSAGGGIDIRALLEDEQSLVLSGNRLKAPPKAAYSLGDTQPELTSHGQLNFTKAIHSAVRGHHRFSHADARQRLLPDAEAVEESWRLRRFTLSDF